MREKGKQAKGNNGTKVRSKYIKEKRGVAKSQEGEFNSRKKRKHK